MSVIVVTGGATGIGRATALLAGRKGYNVAIASLESTMDDAWGVVETIRSYGPRAVAIATDVTNSDDVVTLFEKVKSEFGIVAGLVNAAGILYSELCTHIDIDRVAEMNSVNINGLMLCSREAARVMMTSRGGEGGAIVNISSMAATIGGRPRGACYAASKAAVDAFTTGMAKEVASEGIRVNAVRPGLIATGVAAEMIEDAAWRTSIEESIPLGRLGRPEEVAEAILWLMSEDCAWTSGAHLNVSGGGFLVSGSF